MNLRHLKILLESTEHLAIANNPETPAEQLTTFVKHPNKEIRQAVASNPNTPFSSLIQLNREFPKEISENPYMEMEKQITMGGNSPSFPIHTINPDEIEHGLQNSKTDPAILHMFASHPDKEVQRFLTEHPNIHTDTLHQLIQSPASSYIASYAAQSPNLSKEHIDHVIEHKPKLHSSVARNPNLDAQQIEKLIDEKDPYVYVLSELADHKHTTPEQLDKMSQLLPAESSTTTLLSKIARNSKTQTPTLQKILDYYTTNNQFVPVSYYSELVQHTNATKEMLYKAFDHTPEHQYYPLLNSPHMDGFILNEILKSRPDLLHYSKEVIPKLATLPDAKPETLALAAKHMVDHISRGSNLLPSNEYLIKLLQHPNFPSEFAQSLRNDMHKFKPKVRKAILAAADRGN